MFKFISGPSCSGKTTFLESYVKGKKEIEVPDLMRNKDFIRKIKAKKTNIYEWQKELIANFRKWLASRSRYVDNSTYIIDGGISPLNYIIFIETLLNAKKITPIQHFDLFTRTLSIIERYKHKMVFYELKKVPLEELYTRLEKRNLKELADQTIIKSYFSKYYNSFNYWVKELELKVLPISKL